MNPVHIFKISKWKALDFEPMDFTIEWPSYFENGLANLFLQVNQRTCNHFIPGFFILCVFSNWFLTRWVFINCYFVKSAIVLLMGFPNHEFHETTLSVTVKTQSTVFIECCTSMQCTSVFILILFTACCLSQHAVRVWIASICPLVHGAFDTPILP